jgi:hypothetical protein
MLLPVTVVVEVRRRRSIFLAVLKEIRRSSKFQVHQLQLLKRISSLVYLSLQLGMLISNGMSWEATPPMVVVEGRSPSGGYAAHRSGRLAVFLTSSLLLVEWRPFLFLPANVPEGRQWPFPATSMVFFHGSFVVPSGVIPGGGEVLVQEWSWTQLHSPSDVWGPLCKREGPSCNFLFPLDRSVSCTLLILI